MPQVRWFNVYLILLAAPALSFQFNEQKSSLFTLCPGFDLKRSWHCKHLSLTRFSSLRKHKPITTEKGEALLIKNYCFFFCVFFLLSSKWMQIHRFSLQHLCLSQNHWFLQIFTSLFFCSFKNSSSLSCGRLVAWLLALFLSQNVKYWLKTDYYYYCCFVRFQFSKHRDAPLTWNRTSVMQCTGLTDFPFVFSILLWRRGKHVRSVLCCVVASAFVELTVRCTHTVKRSQTRTRPPSTHTIERAHNLMSCRFYIRHRWHARTPYYSDATFIWIYIICWLVAALICSAYGPPTIPKLNWRCHRESVCVRAQVYRLSWWEQQCVCVCVLGVRCSCSVRMACRV